ncbi:type IV pilin [Methanocalculus taiwanensis]|uniref:Type IV pilin n=1 Tax=Methanocalculus taiwanensis TaxID=106207 RepID=A0ABD4TKP7_9EURY|nr:type IV pilin N-terminal domain-containing protein [Methanocalculus taiwanensis]MCQ1538862.1 type IV pilin [Methanocalculus taiwanensis]
MMQQNSAVSEVIGSILLISLVILAVIIIGVGFLSQPPPVQTQDLNVIAGNTTTTLFIYHDGGDSMVPGEFALLLDGNPVDPIPAPSGGWPWEIGEVLEVPITTTPQRIQIVSLRGGQQNLIREISIGQVTGGGVPITPGPAPTPGPGGQCTQEELDEYAEEYLEDNYVEYFSEKLDNDAVYFTRLTRGPTGQTYVRGWVNLTINSTDSYIIRSTTGKMNLNLGDLLSIRYVDSNSGTADIFSVGNKGWSFSGDVTNIYVNNVLYSGNLVDSWITSFNNFQSTLEFKSVGSGGGVQTRLIVENQTLVDQVNNNNYELINIRPAEPTLLILNFPSEQGKPIRFIGKVDQIKQGTTIIYP